MASDAMQEILQNITQTENEYQWIYKFHLEVSGREFVASDAMQEIFQNISQTENEYQWISARKCNSTANALELCLSYTNP